MTRERRTSFPYAVAQNNGEYIVHYRASVRYQYTSVEYVFGSGSFSRTASMATAHKFALKEKR